jgi:hypothetical protein
MKKANRLLAMSVFCLGWMIPLAAQSTPEISGIWIGKAEMNGGGMDALTVTLKKDGKSFSGTIVDEMGLMPEGTAVKDIVLKGDKLTFGFQAKENTNIMEIKVSLTIGGDKMTGRWEDSQSGTGGGVELSRKK